MILTCQDKIQLEQEVGQEKRSGYQADLALVF